MSTFHEVTSLNEDHTLHKGKVIEVIDHTLPDCRHKNPRLPKVIPYEVTQGHPQEDHPQQGHLRSHNQVPRISPRVSHLTEGHMKVTAW